MSYLSQNALDVADNLQDFARMGGQYIEVFMQNPVVVNATMDSYADPKVYSFQIFFDPKTVAAETMPLLTDAGIVKRVAPANEAAAKIRCMELRFKSGLSVAGIGSNLYVGTTWGFYLGTLKDTTGNNPKNALYSLFESAVAPKNLVAAWDPSLGSGNNPRNSTLPRFPLTYFRFLVYPIEYAANSPWMTTNVMAGELVGMYLTYWRTGNIFPENRIGSTYTDWAA